MVDRKPDCDKYSVQMLEEWKLAREGDLTSDLRSLTEDDLERMLTDSVRKEINETKSELLTAIDAVKGIGNESVLLLKMLVAETFDRPYLDLGVVTSLSESAGLLRSLPEFSRTLQESAIRLAGLEDIVQVLNRLPSELQGLAGNVSMLRNSLEDARKIPDHARTLRDATEPLRGLPDSILTLRQAVDDVQNLSDLAGVLSAATEPLRELPEHALAVQRSNEALATSQEQVQQLSDSLRSLDTTKAVNPALLAKITAASSQLSSVLKEIVGNIDKIKQVSEQAPEATRRRTPDRLTYVIWGIVIGAAAVISVVASGIWPQ